MMRVGGEATWRDPDIMLVGPLQDLSTFWLVGLGCILCLCSGLRSVCAVRSQLSLVGQERVDFLQLAVAGKLTLRPIDFGAFPATARGTAPER